jgi:hypothetical protein
MDHDQHENDDAQRRGDYCPCGGGACARLHDAASSGSDVYTSDYAAALDNAMTSDFGGE